MVVLVEERDLDADQTAGAGEVRGVLVVGSILWGLVCWVVVLRLTESGCVHMYIYTQDDAAAAAASSLARRVEEVHIHHHHHEGEDEEEEEEVFKPDLSVIPSVLAPRRPFASACGIPDFTNFVQVRA